MKIYLACGLTHVPRNRFHRYVQFIHDLASALANAGNEVKYALRDSDPQLAEKPFDERARLCYLWDRSMVEGADVVVADSTFPAIGLGIEIQIAESKDIPIVLCFQRAAATQAHPAVYENRDGSRHTLQIGEGYVSLMALGVPSIFKAIGYSEPADALAQVVEAVALCSGTNSGQ